MCSGGHRACCEAYSLAGVGRRERGEAYGVAFCCVCMVGGCGDAPRFCGGVSTPACQVLLQVRAGRAHRALACLFVYSRGGASHRPDGHFLPARFSEPFPSDTYGKKREMTNETREGAKGGAEARPMSDVRARRRGAGAAGTGMAMPRERGVISPPLCALWCHLIGQRATRNGRSPLFLFVGKRGRGGGKGPITEQRAALIGAALSTPSATCREQPEANDISPAVGG